MGQIKAETKSQIESGMKSRIKSEMSSRINSGTGESNQVRNQWLESSQEPVIRIKSEPLLHMELSISMTGIAAAGNWRGNGRDLDES